MGKKREDDDLEERDSDDDEDRDKPSWSEIDHLRDHPEERENDKKAKPRAARAAATYRSQLDRAFDEGELAERVEPRPTKKTGPVDPDAGEPAGRAAMIRRIRAATEVKQRHEALDQMLAAGERLPDDTSLLAALIDHPKEDLVRQILVHIDSLLERQPLKHKASFIMRLETLKLTADEGSTIDIADRLLDRLR